MSDSRKDQIERLRVVLEQRRRERRTMTYLEAADSIPLDPPHRIHQVARLLEIMLKQDCLDNRPRLSALVVSRVRGGLPAPGFFDRARRLGLYDGRDPARFHRQLLDQLYQDDPNP